ncbi:MAG TPA: GatB/YqeY domain-containing protein [Pseudosphingobacterium sp.]|nr:GatB/YqeY domain-containing protein [Pseudosphingobacterium sp.]
MSLENTINQDIKSAMLAKDEPRLRALRAIKSALLLAKTEKGASEILSEDAEIKVLQKLMKQRKESAEIYQQQNRQDLYQIEKEEQDVIETYLPKQLGREEISERIQAIITQLGASGMKDMGRVMAMANKELAGTADGRTVSEIVKELLNT